MESRDELETLMHIADIRGSVAFMRNGKRYVMESMQPRPNEEEMRKRALASLDKLAEAMKGCEPVPGDEIPD